MVDVYDVLKAFGVTCPAMQHALKRMLCSGKRGKCTTLQDMEEAIQSIQRSIELEVNDAEGSYYQGKQIEQSSSDAEYALDLAAKVSRRGRDGKGDPR